MVSIIQKTNNLLSRGFTVAEITLVVVVIGILATIATSSFNGAQARSYEAAVASDAEQMEAALQNYAQANGGVVKFSDSSPTQYSYSEAAAAGEGGEILKALNEKIDFHPTKGNSVDVKTTSDFREYCIRVYNEKAVEHTTVFNAYEVASSKNVINDTSSCSYKIGGQPTVYSGGAIPGAVETVYDASTTYVVASNYLNGQPPIRLEVAIIAAGGSGAGNCGGSGGGVFVASIANPTGTYPITVGTAAAPDSGGAISGSSSFSTYTATGGRNPSASCGNGVYIAAAGGTGGTFGPASQKYGAGGNGGTGGNHFLSLLGITLPNAAGDGITGGGGYGALGLTTGGGAGGNGTYSGGGGGGSITCNASDSANPGGPPGTTNNLAGGTMGNGGCEGANKGAGGKGGPGSGGGGKANISGGVGSGRGGDGQVRVLTCYVDTCNPLQQVPTP